MASFLYKNLIALAASLVHKKSPCTLFFLRREIDLGKKGRIESALKKPAKL